MWYSASGWIYLAGNPESDSRWGGSGPNWVRGGMHEAVGHCRILRIGNVAQWLTKAGGETVAPRLIRQSLAMDVQLGRSRLRRKGDVAPAVDLVEGGIEQAAVQDQAERLHVPQRDVYLFFDPGAQTRRPGGAAPSVPLWLATAGPGHWLTTRRQARRSSR